MARVRITKNGRRLIYIGIIAYLLFLLHALPATFLVRYVFPRLDHGRLIQLQNVHGSIWQGQAGSAKVSGLELGKLQWDIHSWGLLLAKLKLGLKFGDQTTRGSAYVSLGMGGALDAEDVNFQLPAQNLMPLFYGFPVSIAGTLRGNLKQVSLEQGKVLQLQGRVLWQSAAIRTPQNLDIGEYLITLEPVNLGSRLVIKDQAKGPVQCEIKLTVKGAGEYKLTGWIKPRNPNQQEITEALRWLGKPDSSGRYWVRFNGMILGWKK